LLRTATKFLVTKFRREELNHRLVWSVGKRLDPGVSMFVAQLNDSIRGEDFVQLFFADCDSDHGTSLLWTGDCFPPFYLCRGVNANLTRSPNRIGGFVYEHGEQFYHFEGLRAFKQKFDPEWSPNYLASPGGLAAPRILYEVNILISGGLRGLTK